MDWQVVTLGDGMVIGRSVSIKDPTTIHSGATVAAGSGVMGDVDAGTTVCICLFQI